MKPAEKNLDAELPAEFTERRKEYLTKMVLDRIDGLSFLRQELENIELWSKRKNFCNIIGFAIELGITQTHIGKALNTNTGTVSRWAAELSCPPEYVRPTVLEHIGELIAKEMTRLEEHGMAA